MKGSNSLSAITTTDMKKRTLTRAGFSELSIQAEDDLLWVLTDNHNRAASFSTSKENLGWTLEASTNSLADQAGWQIRKCTPSLLRELAEPETE